MLKKMISLITAVLLFAAVFTGCSSKTDKSEIVSRQPDDLVDSEVTDLQLALLNHVAYKDLDGLMGQSIEGHRELIRNEYLEYIPGGEKLVDELKGYTLVDFDHGDPTGFRAAAFTKGNSIVLVYCGTEDFKDFIEDFKAGLFDFSSQDGQAKQFAKDNVNRYPYHDLYVTGYSMGGRLCYLGTEELYDNLLAGGLRKVRTFNGLGVKEAFDVTDINLSHIHKLEMKYANYTYNYVTDRDFVSDRINVLGFMFYLGYVHVGEEIRVPCTNNCDDGNLKQHDLYSIIEYLLNNPEPGAQSGNGYGGNTETEPAPTAPVTQAPPETEPPAEEKASLDFLIGDWCTSDGVYLSFYDDGYFEMEWSFFPTEEGEWYAEPISSDTYYIEMDGSLILSLMSMIYGAADSDYHFEILKNGENGFYLVQVYGDYTAQSSPCKLSFSRY